MDSQTISVSARVLESFHATILRQSEILETLKRKLDTHERLLQRRTSCSLLSHVALTQDTPIKDPVVDANCHPPLRSSSPSKRMSSSLQTATVAAPVVPTESIPVPPPTTVESIALIDSAIPEGGTAAVMPTSHHTAPSIPIHSVNTPRRLSTAGALSSARLKARTSTRIQSLVTDVMQKLRKSTSLPPSHRTTGPSDPMADRRGLATATTASSRAGRHHSRPVRRGATTAQAIPPQMQPTAAGEVGDSSWDANTRLKELEAIKASNTLALERTHSSSHGLFCRTGSTLRGRHQAQISDTTNGCVATSGSGLAMPTAAAAKTTRSSGVRPVSSSTSSSTSGTAKAQKGGALPRQGTTSIGSSTSGAMRRPGDIGTTRSNADNIRPVPSNKSTKPLVNSSASPTPAGARRGVGKPITASRLSGKTPRKLIERLVVASMRHHGSGHDDESTKPREVRPPPPNNLSARAAQVVKRSAPISRNAAMSTEKSKTENRYDGSIAVPATRAAKVSKPPWSSTTKLPPTRDPVPLARTASRSAILS